MENEKKNLLIVKYNFLPFTPSYGQIARYLTMAIHFSKRYNVNIISAKGNEYYGDFGYNISGRFNLSYVEGKSLVSKRFNTNDTVNKKKKFSKLAYIIKKYGIRAGIIEVILFIQRIIQLDQFEFPTVKEIQKAVFELVRQNNISIIIIATPPYSIQKIAAPVKKRFPNVKLLIDYQDSWIIPALLPKKSISSYRAKWIERKSLMYADYIIFNVPIMKKRYDEYYNIHDKTKLFIMGYDSNYTDRNKFVRKIDISFPDNVASIGYFGKIHIGNNDYFRDIRKLFDVFKNSEQNFKNKFHLDIYGHFSGDHEIWKTHVPFNYKGVLEYRKINAYMIKYDYLLIFHSDSARAEEVLTGKLFEYLETRKPVIVLGPTNMIEARALVEKNNLGIFININRPNEIKEKLLFLHDLKVAGDINKYFNKDFDLVQYDRNKINESYLKFIEEI